MCGINSGYHDVNICYYGRTIVHFNKTVRKIKFHHIKKEVVTVILITQIYICMLTRTTTTVNSMSNVNF